MKRKLNIIHKLPINGLMFAVYIAVGILAYARPGWLINEVFILLCIIVLCDGIYFFLVIPHLKVEIYVPQVVEKYQMFSLKISIANWAYVSSPYLYIKPKDRKRVTLEDMQSIGIMLGPRDRIEQEIYYKAQFCGVEEIRIEEVSMRSFMGFFRKTSVLNLKETIQVLPEIRHLNYMQHFTSFVVKCTISQAKQSNQGDKEHIGGEVGYELRPYMNGDSQRLIHWKIAAFRDEYLVRQREESKEQKEELLFILNPFIEWESNERGVVLQDKSITTFVSLAAYYLKQEQKVRVAYYKEKEWQYMKLSDSRCIHNLREALSDYAGVKVEETINQRGIIKNLFKLTKKRGGIKVMISSYWKKDMEDYILRNKFETKTVSIIWTASRLPITLSQVSRFPIWHMTDEYGLVLASDEKLELINDIDEI